jgi:hypothetical protein
MPERLTQTATIERQARQLHTAYRAEMIRRGARYHTLAWSALSAAEQHAWRAAAALCIVITPP